MVKKRASKTSKRAEVDAHEEAERLQKEDLLIENFVGLQHAMTNLSVKFGNLSDNISKLLEIFEEAAKAITKSGGDHTEEIAKKIDYLLDQNKTISRGLVMMEEKVRGHVGQAPPLPAPPMQQMPPIPPQNQPPVSGQPRPRPLPRV